MRFCRDTWMFDVNQSATSQLARGACNGAFQRCQIAGYCKMLIKACVPRLRGRITYETGFYQELLHRFSAGNSDTTRCKTAQPGRLYVWTLGR